MIARWRRFVVRRRARAAARPPRSWRSLRTPVGVVLVGVGAGLIYLPAGLIVAGLLVLLDVITD